MKNKSPYDTHIRMKEIREALGMSQLFVADRLGLHPSNYFYLESGEQHIRLETIIKFWDLIHDHGYVMQLETLITGKERKSAPKIKHIRSFK